MTKLKNQRALTQTAYFGGENGGGEAGRVLEMFGVFGLIVA
jgi:hypothetical protein